MLDLSQSAAEALAEYVRSQLGSHIRPGIVVSIATAGDLLQWNPHGHVLITDGTFQGLESGTARPLMRLLREPLPKSRLDR